MNVTRNKYVYKEVFDIEPNIKWSHNPGDFRSFRVEPIDLGGGLVDLNIFGQHRKKKTRQLAARGRTTPQRAKKIRESLWW